MASSMASSFAAAHTTQQHRLTSRGRNVRSSTGRAPAVSRRSVVRCEATSPSADEYSRAFSLDLKRPMGMVLNSGNKGIGAYVADLVVREAGEGVWVWVLSGDVQLPDASLGLFLHRAMALSQQLQAKEALSRRFRDPICHLFGTSCTENESPSHPCGCVQIPQRVRLLPTHAE